MSIFYEAATRMLKRLPPHKCGLYLEHNPHRDNYESVDQYVSGCNYVYEWASDEAKQRAIESDELWTLQWYPNTPVGSIAVAAPTLAELLELSAKE